MTTARAAKRSARSRTGKSVKGATRRETKELRRRQLIEATIDSLARSGHSQTTMAMVAEGAGLSQGIVNFHFDSKEKLLIETLRHLSDEYRAHWRDALKRAGPSAAEKLRALVAADFDRKVCTQRKLAAWCAFWGEAKSRPTYKEYCGANDREYQATVVDLCRALAAKGQSPERLARGLVCALEGLWLNRMMSPKDLARAEARASAFELIAGMFPRHLAPDGKVKA